MAATARVKLDPFLMAIIAAAVVASFLPATGVGAQVLSWATKVAIFCLFFLYGARLHPEDAVRGLKHWRLHLTILAFTFVVFPLIGLAIGQLPGWALAPALIPGMVYVTLCPSTVQSSINFTSIARGNVAGAIVSASASNLLGVFLTPLLAIALMNTTGNADVGLGSILDLVVQILLPFILGQLSRRWTADFVARHKRLKLFDQAYQMLGGLSSDTTRSIVQYIYEAGFVGYRELSDADKRTLTDLINALAEPLSQLTSTILEK